MNRLSYASGHWYCLVRTETVVLLPADVGHAVVNAVWDALSSGSGVERVLKVLPGNFTGGLSAVPPFAVVSFSEGLHVLLRGAVQLTAGTGASQTHVSGQGLSTWSERVLDSQENWTLNLSGALSWSGEETLPLVAGVVMAAAVWAGTGTDAEVDPIPEPAAQEASVADDDADEETIHPDLFATTASEEPAEEPSGLVEEPKTDIPGEAPAAPTAPAMAEQVAGLSTGPTVLARLCPKGHANAPTVSLCSVCGQPVSGDTNQVRRPSLGRMRLSTGDVYELESSLIVGRQPSVSRVQGRVMPRLVQVVSESGDISRSHVEVRLEGWHVMLRDLRATNGTVLIRSGQLPRRLGEGEMAILLDGDIAQLGEDVSLRFEDLR